MQEGNSVIAISVCQAGRLRDYAICRGYRNSLVKPVLCPSLYAFACLPRPHRATLLGNRHLRTETRRLASERGNSIRDGEALEDHHVNQHAPAIRRGRNSSTTDR